MDETAPQIESDFLYTVGVMLQERGRELKSDVVPIDDLDFDLLRRFFRAGYRIGQQRRDGVTVGMVQ